MLLQSNLLLSFSMESLIIWFILLALPFLAYRYIIFYRIDPHNDPASVLIKIFAFSIIMSIILIKVYPGIQSDDAKRPIQRNEFQDGFKKPYELETFIFWYILSASAFLTYRAIRLYRYIIFHRLAPHNDPASVLLKIFAFSIIMSIFLIKVYPGIQYDDGKSPVQRESLIIWFILLALPFLAYRYIIFYRIDPHNDPASVLIKIFAFSIIMSIILIKVYPGIQSDDAKRPIQRNEFQDGFKKPYELETFIFWYILSASAFLTYRAIRLYRYIIFHRLAPHNDPASVLLKIFAFSIIMSIFLIKVYPGIQYDDGKSPVQR